MLFVRSLLFNVLFYLNMIVLMVAGIPTLLMPRKAFLRILKTWTWSSLWLLRVVVGLRLEFRGLDRIPRGGLLVAAKHQSLLETFALLAAFDDPAFVLKRELMWLPLFGWLARKSRMVPVNRSAGSAALVEMNRLAREAAAEGRQILIFPEGTRRPAGAGPAYKFGIAHLYTTLEVPCLPVALNTGLFWPRRRFVRYPGTTVIEFLDPIPPGLPRSDFFRLVQERIEEASGRLLEEGKTQLAAQGHGAPVLDRSAA